MEKLPDPDPPNPEPPVVVKLYPPVLTVVVTVALPKPPAPPVLNTF